MKAKYIDKTFPITLQDLIDLAKSENKDPRDLKLIMNSDQADLAAYVQVAMLNQDQGNTSIELYVSADDGFDEDVHLKQTKIPKSPMKQNQLGQAQNYLREINGLIENRGPITNISVSDLGFLSVALKHIKDFIQKQ